MSETAVLDVTSLTSAVLFRALALALPKAEVVALDCELTGLGAAATRGINRLSPPQRYIALKDVAASRALLSVGVCCLQRVPRASNGGREEKGERPIDWLLTQRERQTQRERERERVEEI
jgi:hypothetical protein